MWDIISAMKRDGVTVILTTHLMDEAEALADKVVIIDRGAVVAQGTTAELTSHDSFPLITLSTDRELAIAPLNDALSAHSLTAQATRPLRYQISGGATPEVVATLAREADAQGVLLREFSVAHRTLEDVFLDITGRELRS